MPRKASTATATDTAVAKKTIAKKETAATKAVKAPAETVKATPKAKSKTAPEIELKTESMIEQDIEPVKTTYRVKESLTPSTYVTVKNGFNGKLVFKSSKTNERFIWDGFGTEQDIELQELKSAKNSHKAFFENNWFLFDNPEVIHYLGVDKLYSNAMNYNEFDELFTHTPDEVTARISTLPAGQKQSLIYRAKQMIASGEIDSMKMINALETSLAVELIER